MVQQIFYVWAISWPWKSQSKKLSFFLFGQLSLLSGSAVDFIGCKPIWKDGKLLWLTLQPHSILSVLAWLSMSVWNVKLLCFNLNSAMSNPDKEHETAGDEVQE